MAKKTKPDIIKQNFTIDPHISVISLMGFTPEGYEVVALDRKETKAIVTYRKIRKAR
jgi:hypothetical protein